MANTIILKKSSVAGKVPLSTDLTFGEVAINYADGKIYYKNTNTNIDFVGNGGTFTNKLSITDTTVSTSTTTGALTVAGGTGIGGNLYIDGIVRIQNSTTNTTSDTGALVVSGGAGFGGNIHVQGYGHFGLEPSIILANPLAVFTGNVNSYNQIAIQNLSNGLLASSDIVATANDGDDTSGYIDLGINNSNYSSVDWTMSGARDGYLYVSGNNLTLGTDTTGKEVRIHVGGTLAADVVAIFRDPGTVSTSDITGSFNVSGGAGITGDVHIGETLHIGANPLTALSNTLMIGTANIDGFTQVSIQNKSTGPAASADFVVTADDGDDTTGYIDLGLNNSGYSNVDWTISGARDGYLYVAGNSLTLGTDSTGTTVKIHVGGTTASNIVATFNEPNTNSTSTLTGSLVIAGGAGISGNLYVGGTINGNLTGTATTATNWAGGTVSNINIDSTLETPLTITTVGRPGNAINTWTFFSNQNPGGPSSWIQFPDGTLQTTAWTGIATSANSWTTARTITLGGDLTGSVSIDGSSNVTLTATVAANSVELGTDTTGNYVATGDTSGFGLSGSSNSEGGTFTVTSNATSTNASSTLVFRDSSGNFSAGTITANLTGNVTGTATTATNIGVGSANQIIYKNASNITTSSSGLVYDGVSIKVNGNLESTFSSGDEGGEIQLAKPATNTTLAGPVSIDIYQNKLRFFETGGSARGFYIDITSGTTNAGTDLVTGSGTPFNGGTITGALTINNSTSASSTNSGALQIINGGAGIGGNLVADQVWSVNNGNGTNFKVGDDAWIGDYNVSNSIRIKGQQDSTQAYLVFGDSNGSNYIGRSGTNPITVTGPFNTTGVTKITDTTAASSTITGALVVTGGVGIGGALYINTTSFIAGDQILTTATVNSFVTAGVSSITAGTDTAVSTSTGAITIWNTSTLQSVTSRGATTNQAVSITNTTSSTSTSTGALIVSGGVGIGENLSIFGDLNIGSGSDSTKWTSTSSELSVISLGTKGALGYLHSSGVPILAHNVYYANEFKNSSSSTGGAVYYQNQNVHFFSTFATGQTANSTATETLVLSIVGDKVRIGNISPPSTPFNSTLDIYGDVWINSSTQATSTITGALRIVNGGIGVGGNAHIGGNIVVRDTAIVGNASTTSVLTSAVTIDSFAAATYRSAQYIISVSNAGLGEYQTSDVLVVHNGTNSFVQATSVFTGNKALLNFSTTISGGNVLLQGTGNQTGANANIVKIQKTYITI